jgi:hypothetical protein
MERAENPQANDSLVPAKAMHATTRWRHMALLDACLASYRPGSFALPDASNSRGEAMPDSQPLRTDRYKAAYGVARMGITAGKTVRILAAIVFGGAEGSADGRRPGELPPVLARPGRSSSG